MTVGRHRKVGAWLLAGGVLVLQATLVAAFTAGSATAVDGNKGTVKIAGVDVDGVVDADDANHPHVQNPFALRWYGYEAGDHTTAVSFEAQPPSGTSTMPILEGRASFAFTASGSGGDLNHTEVYRLDTTGLEEHEVQGFHVKVTVTVPNTQGNDTKHKVFWITEPEPTESPTPSPTVSPTVSPTETESPTVSPSVLPTRIESPTESVSPSVLGVKRVRRLPRTGPPATAVTAAAGALLVIVGTALLTWAPKGAHQR